MPSELKSLPHSIELEESILASCLTDNAVCGDLVDLIVPTDFYATANAKIFKALVDIYKKDQVNDIVLLMESLKASGEVEAIGGAMKLANLMDGAIAIDHEVSARKLREKAALRRTIEICHAMTKKCYADGEDVHNDIDRFQTEIHDIQIERNSENISSLHDLILRSSDEYVELYNNAGSLTGVPTGYSDLDGYLCGLQETDLIILAARPAMGKSSLAVNIAKNAAKDTGVAIFSLEMSENQLRDKLISMESGVNGHKFRSGKFIGEDWNLISTAQSNLFNVPIFIDDQANIGIYEIKRRVRKLKQKHNLGLVIIDYLQLIQGDNSQNRNLELGAMTRALKIMAKELRVPVLVLSQLNRELEKRVDKRPKLSDLRESGNIEQDADVVMFIHRPAVYYDEEQYPGETEVIIGKQRNGPTGMVQLVWKGHTTSFFTLEKWQEAI